MRAAPAVAVRCSGGPFWCASHIGLPALAAASVAGWATLLASGNAAGALISSLLAATVAGCLALRLWRPQAAQLQWDGQRWAADGAPGRLQLMMDLGSLLVLRLHLDAAGERWLAVSAAEAGPAWPALRAAVYSRPPRATPRALAPERVAD
jgi:hypothetical protein